MKEGDLVWVANIRGKILIFPKGVVDVPYLCLREIVTPLTVLKVRLFREVDGSLYLRYRGGPLRRLIKGRRAV